MGIWGTKLYENDTSLDVKDQFEEKLRNGETAEAITDQLIKDYYEIMDDACEATLFWTALSDTQWNWGVLLPHVKEQALIAIDHGGDLLWWHKHDPTLVLTREKVLDDLRKKLLSPQPPAKKPRKRRLYKCQWNIGDVYAYRLESDLAKEKGLNGRYFLIQKVDEGVWHPGHIIPIVYVKITEDDKLPTTLEEYNRLAYVQTWFTRYEDRFFPIDGTRPQEDIAEKEKIKYEVDEYGFLPQFRIKLLNTSKKVIPTNLTYIGRYENSLKPAREFVPHSKHNIPAVSWKNFNLTFETEMIKMYCGHNCRELSIYGKDQNTQLLS